MRTFSVVTFGLAVISTAFASPASENKDKGTPLHSLSITKVHGKTKAHSYFVKLKKNVNKSRHLQWLKNHTDSDPHSDVSHDFDSDHFNAFSGKFEGHVLDALRQNPDVEAIVPDSLLNTTAIRTQHDAPWNLQRINQKSKLAGASQPGKLNFMYSYDDQYAGKSVDIYVLDSGVKTNHKDFGTRASWGAIFGGYSKKDVFGHGTHVAGIAAGWRFGVAKKANIISVKTMADDGSGWSTDMCAGINWVVKTAKSKPGRYAVINMSVGGVGNPALDQCATNAVNAGIHVVVSAGNDGVDVKDSSPARAPQVVTVGASDIGDEFAYFSNFGPAVDIIAPGADITSDWPGASAVETKEMSGTSMAAPHVAGLIALYLSQPQYAKYTPAKMSDLLKSIGRDGAIARVPKGTRNDFLQTKSFK